MRDVFIGVAVAWCVALGLLACDTNECGTIVVRGVITGPVTFNIDCPGDQDISPGNTFDAEGTVSGWGLSAPAQPASPTSVRSAPVG